MKINPTTMKAFKPGDGPGAVRKSRLWNRIKRQHILLWMSVPIMLHLMVFQFVPLWGWLMAFKDYKIGRSVWSAEWVGFAHFKELLSHDGFFLALRNNFAMNSMQLVAGTFFAIALAVVLSELRSKGFVRVVQTMTYLPHFVSMVVVANIFVMLLSPDGGLVNVLLVKLGWIDEGIFFFGKATWFWVLHTIILTWKGFGWGAIIYLAAISGIDPNLYDAAQVDGASRWQRIKYIIIPCIIPTFVLLTILSIGSLMTGGFESQFLLGNNITQEYSEVISILALRLGLNQGDFSFGTAVGIFNSLVSITLVLIVNAIARRYQTNLF
ncbi:ABC transporter permease [Paenibacillus sp. strain BS8-2]